MALPVLIVLAGPNGAGKSTYYETYLRPVWGKLQFINADLIARARWPDEAEQRSYEAAREADRLRDEALARKESFITETVFSHESKLELLRRARSLGYVVRVFFVGIDSPRLSERRVHHRVGRGGHSVPVAKLAPRYARTLALLPEVLRLATHGTVMDNSHADPYLDVLEVHEGRIVDRREPVPRWLQPVVRALETE